MFWGAFTGREPEKNRANIDELLRWYVEGKIRPHISAVYPFERYAQALNDLAQRKAKGKVVLKVAD